MSVFVVSFFGAVSIVANSQNVSSDQVMAFLREAHGIGGSATEEVRDIVSTSEIHNVELVSLYADETDRYSDEKNRSASSADKKYRSVSFSEMVHQLR